MRILVLGASGGVGKHLVRIASEREHHITALVRAQSSTNEGPRVRVVRGEVVDPAALDAVMAGQECVVSGLGLRRTSASPFAPLTGAGDFTSSATRVIVDAMKRRGVKRVLQVSAAGVAESAPHMNFVMRFLVAKSNIGVAYRDLAIVEKVYAESGLEWCCVRPVSLTNGKQTERVRGVDRFAMTATISRADVAWWMITHAESGPLEPRTPQIAAG